MPSREEIPKFKTLEEEKEYWEERGAFGIKVIREEIDKILIGYARAVSEVEEKELMTHSMMRKEWGVLLEKVKQGLSDLGVVIKVDGELPEYVGCVSVSDKITKAIAQEAQNDMLKAGYVAVEPLVGEPLIRRV